MQGLKDLILSLLPEAIYYKFIVLNIHDMSSKLMMLHMLLIILNHIFLKYLADVLHVKLILIFLFHLEGQM